MWRYKEPQGLVLEGKRQTLKLFRENITVYYSFFLENLDFR